MRFQSSSYSLSVRKEHITHTLPVQTSLLRRSLLWQHQLISICCCNCICAAICSEYCMTRKTIACRSLMHRNQSTANTFRACRVLLVMQSNKRLTADHRIFLGSLNNNPFFMTVISEAWIAHSLFVKYCKMHVRIRGTLQPIDDNSLWFNLSRFQFISIHIWGHMF